MPTITHDGQSFSIDGRRRWLVAGSLDYARTARPQWQPRIAAARQAGLNCVSVAVNWSLHEPSPGRFDFKGDLDVAEFIRTIARAGLLCILRPGPFIDSGWDMGGLPPWLLTTPGMRLRAPEAVFLEACSRWISAIMDQVRTLQFGPRTAGPIALIQVEHEWFCGDDAAARGYLGELGRYFRENGLSVPLVNGNNLFPMIEGEIDAWTGSGGLHAVMRQLRRVRPATPRLVAELRLARPAVWGAGPAERPSPDAVIHRLAQVLAAGAQFNAHPFHAGSTFAFHGGRIPGAGAGGFAASASDDGAPVGEAGVRGTMYAAVKRVCTFASSFERLFAGLDPQSQPAVLDPESLLHAPAARQAAPPVSVIHCAGAQGSVVFVFGSLEAARAGAGAGAALKPRAVHRVTMPDGSSLPVDLSGQPVAWCLVDAPLLSRATLDYANISAFAVLGRVFVCFGPAGAHAVMAISGSHFEATVPDGDEPLVEEHEGVVVVICSERQIDAAYVSADAVHIGASGLDAQGAPVVHPDFGACVSISAEGAVTRRAAESATRPRSPRAIAIEDWATASTEEFVAGASDRFATIDGPASLEALGAPYGYGWVRLRITAAAARRALVGFFDSADRIHLFHDGEPLAVLGDGPGLDADGQERLVSIGLRKGVNAFTILVDNLGRWSSGVAMGERKGVHGHAWEVKHLRVGKPTLETGPPLEPLKARSPLWGVHASDRTDPRRLVWTFSHRRKTPVCVSVRTPDAFPRCGPGDFLGMLLVNDHPARILGCGLGVERILLPPEALSRGNNTVEIAAMTGGEPLRDALAGAVHFYECEERFTERADWAFARWSPPPPAAFKPASRTAPVRPSGRPAWWRGRFAVKSPGASLFLVPDGLTKGQVYVNGRNACRYFIAGPDGARLEPERRCHIPGAWLREGENEVVIFDEHGGAPVKCRLVPDGASER